MHESITTFQTIHDFFLSNSRMRKIARRSRVLQTSSSARTFGNAWKKLTNVMESPTATMVPMNWDAHRWNRISAIRKNISVAKLQEFAFQLLGTAMVLTTAMITRTKKIADPFHAQTTSTSAKTLNAFSKRTFVMEKTIAVTILMSHMNTLVSHRHSGVQSANGSVLE